MAQVKQAYYGVLQAQVALQAGEEALDFLRESERVMTKLVSTRSVLRYYMLDARSKVAQQRYQNLTAKNAADNAREQLNALMGRPLNTQFDVVTDLPAEDPITKDLDAVSDRALAQRPEVRQSVLQVAQAELAAKAKRSENIPDLSLQVRMLRPYGAGPLPNEIFTATAVLQWTPLDWGQRRNELFELERKLDEARALEADARANVVLDVHAQFRNLAETKELVEANALALETAREQVRVAKERFGVKDILLQDYLQAQTAFANANSQWQQSMASWIVARAALARAMGEE